MALSTSQEQQSLNAVAQVLGMFDRVELIGVVENLKTASSFLLDRCFPETINSNSPQVALDIDIGKRRVAPFVSPLVEGKLVESRRYQTQIYTPPTIKDLRVPDLLRPVRRLIGERIGGDNSLVDRVQQNLIYEIADQKDMIVRRQELMAAEALVTGKLTISGDGYHQDVIDYGRDSSLTVALTGAAQWGQPGVSPVDNCTAWGQHIKRLSGAVPEDIYFTPSAWEKFLADPKLQSNIYQRAMQGPAGDQVQTGGVIPGQSKGAIYLGAWGSYNLWLYNEWFVDCERDKDGKILLDDYGQPQEVEKPLIPDGCVVMSGSQLRGTRAYGLIQDYNFDFQASAYATRYWIENNPGVLNLLTQSAPLIIPSRVNASFCATVCDPGAGVAG